MIIPLETCEGLSYVIKDPESRRFFRLSEPEYCIVREIESGGDAESMMEASIEVSEKDVTDVAIGHPVELRLRAFPEEALDARVTSIATKARSAKQEGFRNAIVVVTARLASTPPGLRSGMTGIGKIVSGERRLYQHLLHRARRYWRIDVWSW